MNASHMTGTHDITFPRLLLWKRDVATAIGLSVRTLERMIATGEIPAPDIQLHGRHAWRSETVMEWVKNGCPGKDNILNPS